MICFHFNLVTTKCHFRNVSFRSSCNAHYAKTIYVSEDHITTKTQNPVYLATVNTSAYAICILNMKAIIYYLCHKLNRLCYDEVKA